MDVKLALSQMIGGGAQQGQQGEMNEKDIVQQQKLCMEILNVANKISPGKLLLKRTKHDGVGYQIKADSLTTVFYFIRESSRVMYSRLRNIPSHVHNSPPFADVST